MDQHIEDLIALAALGELDADGRAELALAAANDAAVATELDATLASVAAIQATLRHDPPPHLRDAVLHRIEHLDQLQAAPATPSGSTRRRPAWRWPAAVAAALALVFGAGVLTLNDGDADPVDTDPVDLAAEVIDADDAVVATMSGTLDGRLVIHASAGEQAIVIEGDDLPAVSQEQTYQLWRLDGDITSLGTFVPDPTGRVEWRIDHAGPPTGSYAVTLEPAGGSATPTSPILAST